MLTHSGAAYERSFAVPALSTSLLQLRRVSAASAVVTSEAKTIRTVSDSMALAEADFRERAAISGCPFPSPHLKGAGLRSSGPCQSVKFKCCTKQKPRPWRPHWQTYTGRSARDAARPEGQTVPPHVFYPPKSSGGLLRSNLPERSSLPSHGFSCQAVTPGVAEAAWSTAGEAVSCFAAAALRRQ